jgi:hypothetical protein
METELARALIDLAEAIHNLADGAEGCDQANKLELARARAEARSVRERVVEMSEGHHLRERD